MSWGEIATLASAIVAVIGLLIMLFRYWLSTERERTKEAVDALQKSIDDLFAKSHETRKDFYDRIETLRKEFYEEFVRHSHYDKAMQSFNEHVSGVNEKLDAVARDLNQLIGKFEAINHG